MIFYARQFYNLGRSVRDVAHADNVVARPFLNILEVVGKTDICDFRNQNVCIIGVFDQDISVGD
jgi:hypothetical protein